MSFFVQNKIDDALLSCDTGLQVFVLVYSTSRLCMETSSAYIFRDWSEIHSSYDYAQTRIAGSQNYGAMWVLV